MITANVSARLSHRNSVASIFLQRSTKKFQNSFFPLISRFFRTFHLFCPSCVSIQYIHQIMPTHFKSSKKLNFLLLVVLYFCIEYPIVKWFIERVCVEVKSRFYNRENPEFHFNANTLMVLLRAAFHLWLRPICSKSVIYGQISIFVCNLFLMEGDLYTFCSCLSLH